MKNLALFFSLFYLSIVGWFRASIFAVKSFFTFWWKKSILEQISIASMIIQVYFTFKQWISYEVNFLNIKETIYISTNVNLLFFMIAISLPLLHFFWNHTWFKHYYVFSQIFLSLLFIAGFLFPRPIFTDMLLKTDYRINNYAYFFAGICLVNLFLAIWRYYSSRPEPSGSNSDKPKEIPEKS
ncbi:MAG: hypothetical protein H7A25_05995 [Leptospiraceae bacterium]|nr:hypothetical protein [Leptospiraceae bacterium]MCP5499434.1 hypothetical protein [Leptospiraceae bacterium]